MSDGARTGRALGRRLPRWGPGGPRPALAGPATGRRGSAWRPALARGPAWRLPAIHAGNRGPAVAWGYAGFCAVYLGAGHFPLRDPVLLAPTRLDLLVPFLPWTVWVYLGQFPLTFLALWRAADDRTRTRTFYAMAAATLLAAAVFLGWPTTGERPRLRPPGPSALAFAALDRVDVPNNWFPSLHVALAALAATGLAAHGRRAGAVAGAAAALVAASTLTTKQHLAVDGAGGLAVAAAAYWLAGRVRPP